MTNTVWGAVALTGASYLLGAIPIGLILARCKGIDIRRVGSNNIGATNVFRSVGKGWGIATFIGDFIKGFVPAFVVPLVLVRWGSLAPDTRVAAGLVFGCAAIAGHNWPVYLRFKGGKGVATSAGVLLGVAPVAVAVGLAGWLGLLLITRYVSVASMGAALIIVAWAWIPPRAGWLLPLVLTGLALLVVLRHRANLRRLFRGEEHRFSFSRRRPVAGTTTPETKT